ncbi:thiolase C-terminal domain-containing protein [Rhodococcus koreensis]
MSAQAIVEGVGQTAYTRLSGRTAESLTLEAIRLACKDAGIEPSEIDGIVPCVYSMPPEALASNLGIKNLRFTAEIHTGGAAPVASLRLAQLAVQSGAARHVLLVVGYTGSSGARVKDRPSDLPSQHLRRQLENPYGWAVPSQRYAMICRRYIHQYGLRKEELGAIAVSARKHANLNPQAQMHGRPLTMEQYLASRMITDPYQLFDCSLETDGAAAVLVTIPEHARTARPHDATIVAVAEGRPETPDDLTNRSDYLAIGLDHAAAQLWETTGLGPTDMDAAMIYDCFTFELLHQLESAGFAAHGEGGKFVSEGGIDLGGSLPVNTHGGHLSGGHMLGLNHVIEAALQIRGECGARQVENARHVAITGWGDLGDGSIAVMKRERLGK